MAEVAGLVRELDGWEAVEAVLVGLRDDLVARFVSPPLPALNWRDASALVRTSLNLRPGRHSAPRGRDSCSKFINSERERCEMRDASCASRLGLSQVTLV